MPRTHLPYPAEFRAEAVRLVRESGKTMTQIAKDLGISLKERAIERIAEERRDWKVELEEVILRTPGACPKRAKDHGRRPETSRRPDRLDPDHSWGIT